MLKDGLVVGLDVGTTKTAVVVGEASENNEIYILGSGVAPSCGIKKGMIINIEETIKTIEAVVSDAEHISDSDIDTVYISVGGYHIQGQNTRGRIIIPPAQKEIVSEDKSRVQEAARAIQLAANYEILHVIPKEYKVDDQDGILDPAGMVGSQLEVETHIITASSIALRNLQKSVKGSGLKIKELVFEGLAAAEAVLTPDEKELGVVLLHIGGGTTDIVAYSNGYVKYSGVLPVGSAHLSSDISIGLRTSFQEAEKLKIKHGSIWLEDIDLNEKISVANAGNDGARLIELRQMIEIMEPRMEEMFSMIKSEIKKIGPAAKIPAGVVLSGGGALLNGIVKFAEKSLEMPVRIGKPNNINGLTDRVNGPAFSACIGLLMYGLKYQNHFNRQPFMRSNSAYDGFKNWLKSFFKDIF